MAPKSTDLPLTPEELATYEWQLAVPGFGEAGQQKLKAATALVSRVGGVGGAAALALAAAGIGRLILAHAGQLRIADLNRQMLMAHRALGKSRIECAAARLRELNPRLDILAVPENLNSENAPRLVGEVDIVLDCAPLFEERFAMNAASVSLRKPMVESAVYALEAQLTTFIPGKSPCLRCLCPEAPKSWKRQFPVFGAVAATIGNLAAMEAIKVLTGLGQPLAGRLFVLDLDAMTSRTCQVRRDPQCPVCAQI